MTAVVVLAVALVLGGCGGDDGPDAVAAPTSTTGPPSVAPGAAPRPTATAAGATTTSSTPAPTAPPPTGPPTSGPPATAAPPAPAVDPPATTSAPTAPPVVATPTPTPPFDGSIDQVVIPRPATTQDVVAHIAIVEGAQAARGAAGGSERHLTFRFEGGLPGVTVRYLDRPVRAAGSGDEVAVAGGAVLGIRFEPASGARFGETGFVTTYTGPTRIGFADGAPLNEAVRTGDFEAVYEWAIGLDAQVPFRVEADGDTGSITVVVPDG